MSRTRRGPPFVGPCIVLFFFFAISGCLETPEYRETTDISDIGEGGLGDDAGRGVDSDGGSGSGFQLRGQLVPTGGLSMSNGFTLSGHLSPGMPGRASSSASFSLTISPAHSQTAP